MSDSVLDMEESVLLISRIEESMEEKNSPASVVLGWYLLWFDAFTNKRILVLNEMTGMTMKGNEMNVNGASGE